MSRFEIYLFKKIDSTNNYAKKLARVGAEEETLIIAEKQTKGRGRKERRWVSEKGGVYLSLILRPKIDLEYLPYITFLGCVSAGESIISFCTGVNYKWPNDILLNGKKVGGILTETSFTGGKLDWVVLGIGINVNNEIKKFSDRFIYPATSIKEETDILISLKKFKELLIQNLKKFYKSFAKRPTEILDLWKKRDITVGSKVSVSLATGRITGRAIKIKKDGSLVVKKNSGKIINITSGDVSILNNI